MKVKLAEFFRKVHGFFPISGADGEGGTGGAGGTGDGGGSGGTGDGGQGGGQGGAGNQGGAGAPDFSKLIPKEYSEKPWVKETKDLGALFKRTDDLITAMGKRPASIPAENAPAEEVAAFNKAWGVPDKPEGYTFADVPKEMALPTPELQTEFHTGVKALFHKAGVSTKQAGLLEKGWNELNGQIMQKLGAANIQQNADFDKLKLEVFGNRADDATDGAKALIAKYAPEKIKQHVAGLSNEALVVLAGVLDGVRKEFISPDRMPQGGAPPTAMTAEQKQAKGRELMASKAYTDPFHADHAKVRAEVEALYGTAPKK